MRFASRPVLEAPAIVPGFDDVTVVGQPIQQRAGHLGVHKNTRPFTEGEIGRHDDGGALIELADQIKQQLTTGLGEGEAKDIAAGLPKTAWKRLSAGQGTTSVFMTGPIANWLTSTPRNTMNTEQAFGRVAC